jgi:hypothetical protein
MSMSMLKGIHRRFLGITRDDQVIARSGFVAGGEDRPAIVLPGAPDTVAIFDDFLGDLVADEWAFAKADTGLTGLVIANITNGVVRLTGSETVAANNPETAGGLTGGLFKQWKADMGGRKGGRLRLSARVKAPITAVAEAGRHHLFVGFSDSGGGEMPAFDTGAGIISQAADVVGFVYGPTSANNTWQCIAAKSTAGDSGDQLVLPSPVITPVSNVYDVLEVEIRNGISDTGGAAHFWINGKKVATINSPVASGTALSPWIGGFVQDTGFALAIDVDYVAISAARDTGE